MSKTLWQKSHYSSRIEYIVDNTIREFDISKANISILRDANVLSETEYQYYLHRPRMERQIAIGKLQGSNTKISEILKSGITNARKIFMESNSIDDSEVLYIRNDAIAIIGPRVIKNLIISEHVSFRQSACYTSFYRFNSMDFLYFYDPVTNIEKLDVKGLGKIGVELHKNFMLEFLSELFYCAQMDGIQNAIRLLQMVHQNYLKRELSIEYYRELNSESRFKLSQSISMFSTVYMDRASEYYKQFLDISHNDFVFRHFMRIYASIYLK